MGTTNHFQNHVEYDAKDIRLINGSRMLCRSPSFTDQFVGQGAINSQIPQNLVQTETGTGASHAVWAPSTTVMGGAAVAVAGATVGDAQELAGKSVIWKPSTMATNMNMVMEARLSFVGATTAKLGTFLVGWADAVTYTSGLAYVVSAASALTTSVPTEFAGFIYSDIPTSGTLYAASGNNYIGAVTTISDTNTVQASSKQKDSNSHIYRVELTSAGHAHFYYDDEKIMTATSAVTAATALTPYIAVIGSSVAVTATLDYIHVGAQLV